MKQQQHHTKRIKSFPLSPQQHHTEAYQELSLVTAAWRTLKLPMDQTDFRSEG
jgi:hypothetical protein